MSESLIAGHVIGLIVGVALVAVAFCVWQGVARHRSRRRGAQPPPVKNDGPEIADLVLMDFAERKRVGIERYGVPLQPFNGRKSLQDAYEELLDLCIYLRKELYERNGR